MTSSLIKRRCYPESYKLSTISTRQMLTYSVIKMIAILCRQGYNHEQEAKNHYLAKASQSLQNLSITEAGLFVDYQNPYLGASPDGLARRCCNRPHVSVISLSLILPPAHLETNDTVPCGVIPIRECAVFVITPHLYPGQQIAWLFNKQLCAINDYTSSNCPVLFFFSSILSSEWLISHLTSWLLNSSCCLILFPYTLHVWIRQVVQCCIPNPMMGPNLDQPLHN